MRLDDGKVVWSEDGFGGGSLLLAGEDLLILRDNGELILAPADTGGFKPRARARILEPTVRAAPALARGRLYARDEKKLVAVDLRRREIGEGLEYSREQVRDELEKLEVN